MMESSTTQSTASQLASAKSRWDSAEGNDFGHYRRVSRLALVAALLGLLSALAFIGPVMWIVPVVALAISILALRQIDREPEMFVGKTWAIAGLLLALLFAAGAMSRTFGRERVVFNHARRFTDEWLELVRDGRLNDAHQWTLLFSARQLPGASLDDYYVQSAAGREQRQKFFGTHPLDELIAAGQRADYRFVRGVKHDLYDQTDYVLLEYSATISNVGGKTETIPLRITVQRHLRPTTGKGDWQISSVALPDPKHR